MTEKPWIIVTMRRTGGTSLTKFLSNISSHSTVEHEPFNRKRKFGHITRDFLEGQNKQSTEQAIRSALAERPNLKHCIEIVPIEVTRILIDACIELEYRIIVLTRRNEHLRLASLFLAQATGAWGPEQAQEIYPKIVSGLVKPPPINLDKVFGRAQADFAALGQVLLLLRSREIDFRWHLFEELYFGEIPIQHQAINVAADLGIHIQPDDKRLDLFSKQQGQKSVDIAPFVENYEQAVEILRKTCPV